MSRIAKLVFIGFLTICCSTALFAGGQHQASSGTQKSASSSSSSTAGSSSSGKKYVFELAGTVPPNTPMGALMTKFKNEVDKNSGGRLEVKIFFSGALGNDVQAIQKTQLGVIQGFNTSSSNMATVADKFLVFDLPYIFRKPSDYKILYQDGAIGGPIGSVLQKQAISKGLRILWFTPPLFRALDTRGKMVKTPSDMKGMKIRTSASPIERAIIKSFGANAVSMGAPQMYTALTEKTIDGVGLPLNSLGAFKVNEAAPYVSNVNYQAFLVLDAMNEKFYQSLPPDLQKVVVQAGNDVVKGELQMFQDFTNTAVTQLKKAGTQIYTPTPSQMQQFINDSKSVVSAYEGKIGKAWIQQVQAAIQANQ